MTPGVYREYLIHKYGLNRKANVMRKYEMTDHITEMGEYTNYFGSLDDIDIRYIDIIMSIISPEINMKRYYKLLMELYADLEFKITGRV